MRPQPGGRRRCSRSEEAEATTQPEDEGPAADEVAAAATRLTAWRVADEEAARALTPALERKSARASATRGACAIGFPRRSGRGTARN